MSGDSEIISKFRDMGVSDRSDMVSKETVWVPDNNGSSYNGQITWDLSSLGQSQKWVNYSEAYIEIPYVIAAKASADFTAGIAANTIGLKDGFHQLIDSIAVEMNGRTAVQVQNFTNVHTQFKMLTSSSFDDIFKNGATTGFFGDDVSTMTYNQVASDKGVGYCNSNNSNFTNRKGQTTNFDVSAANKLPTIVNAEAINSGRSYFTNNGAAAGDRLYYWVVMAQIRLSDITDLFSKMPICKTTDIRLIITYNSSQVVVNCVNASPDTYAVGSYQQISGHTCPFMLSSFTVPNNGTLTIRSNVMKSGLGENATLAVTNCRLYVPIYKPSDSVSLAMIQSFPTSVVEYNDIYTYVVPEITAGQTFCHTLTTGIVDPQYVVVIPYPKMNGFPGLGTATYQSIFDSAPGTSSGIIIRDFNVQLAGTNVFQSNQHYDFEQFNAELSKINSINGNMTLGLTSGSLNYYMFQQGYRMYVADLSRKDSSQSNVTKSITITGVNTTTAIAGATGPPLVIENPNSIELLCFVAYKKKLSIQTSTGILQD